MVLTQKQTEINGTKQRAQNKSMHSWQSKTKEASIYNGEKIVSLINGAGKTGHQLMKESN